MDSDSPESVLRRSQLYRIHQARDAEFEDYDGALCVSHYAESHYAERTGEDGQVRSLGLADLSTLSRIGFKGSGACDWIMGQGGQLPERPNHALTQKDGSLLVRLSEQEILVLRSVSGASALVNRLLNASDSAAEQAAYILPRAESHCWLALTGEYTSQTLAKVCGVDMRLHKFANGNVAQTSLARVNAIVVRHDISKDVPCFYILCDVSLTEFLWVSLLDAMQEFGGQPVGMTGLIRLTLNQV